MTDNLSAAQRSTAGVYAIYTSAKKRVYVGAAKHLGQACNRIRSELRRGQHDCHALQAYATAHRPTALTFEVLATCPVTELAATKQRYLDQLRATDPAHGFNALHSDRPAGQKMSPEARARLSTAKKGRPITKRTPEHQEKLNAAHRGRKRSPETCAAISAATTGKKKRRKTPPAA
jgi:hypothetical protein